MTCCLLLPDVVFFLFEFHDLIKKFYADEEGVVWGFSDSNDYFKRQLEGSEARRYICICKSVLQRGAAIQNG